MKIFPDSWDRQRRVAATIAAAAVLLIIPVSALSDDGTENRDADAERPRPTTTRAATRVATIAPLVTQRTPTRATGGNCSPAYPGVCIPPAPPDLDCGDITARRFAVRAPDPHNFDSDGDGVGCES